MADVSIRAANLLQIVDKKRIIQSPTKEAKLEVDHSISSKRKPKGSRSMMKNKMLTKGSPGQLLHDLLKKNDQT